MTQDNYCLIETYMLSCAADSAHDAEHIYRVLYNALEIAKGEEGVDHDVLIAACLLHDIGRKEQLEDPTKCHAMVGSQKAWNFLRSNGFSEEFAQQVRHCIQVHRFRKSLPPQTVEAKILFDADKLDVTGAIGAARTLQYNGALGEPIYATAPDGTILDGSGEDEGDSYFREHCFKLSRVYDRFLTAAGARMAAERQEAAERFYRDVLREVRTTVQAGQKALEDALE